MTARPMRATCYLSSLFCLGAGCAIVVAQPLDNVAAPTNASTPPMRLPPLPQPPIAYFRQLLALSPSELDKTLGGIAGPIRTNLQAKLREYAGLAPDEREARLRATELQWYLEPLVRTAPTDRGGQLALIPDEYRTLVRERLKQWDALPRETQQEVLENEWMIRSIILPSAPSQRENISVDIPPMQRQKLEKALASWLALPAEKRRRIGELFQQFFDLPPREKEKTLGALSEAERLEMEKTLRAFETLPAEQRRLCIASFRKFANMTLPELADFLKNAERWKEMSPRDRETWRMLVSKLPPLPPGFAGPPMPPGVQPHKSGSAAPPLPSPPVNLTNASP